MKIELLHQADEPLWQKLLLAPLSPPSKVFGAAAAARRGLYGRGLLKQARAPIPVISVGNLAVGGAGKTPVVIELTSRLQARGLKVAVLASGYGGQGRGARVVSRGEGILLDARDAGDEPVLVAKRCPGARVLVGPSRAELAEIAARHLRADVALLDDGFQHLGLARDLDIVVLDGASPFGNGRLLPRGPLREPPSSLARADLCWISKVDEGDPAAIERAAAEAERLTGEAPVRSRYRVSGVLSGDLSSSEPLSSLESRPVLLLAGVARPDSFRRTLTRLGCRVVGEALFSDHHPFTERELHGVLARARACGADVVCATEKDAMRIPAALRGHERIKVVRVETEVAAGADLLESALDAALVAAPVGSRIG
ncbi:tetraacyldisaccharide 4'-kinase [Vulgatibacter incomptus]|uniref:Tetraacyldisaccharide 4'-kinase n=1 Tax=Vulgatibacter incomptus TaxID=1391653 RepID=A0A0K1PAQ2_9BACT|nr:tetraacyldisaccharide 4'-kinase [Vulgatibacter incomptus]AKU90618.1 Tetraacyldisaccharide 4'-kinase [Vulgatibacter incomptus]